MCGCGQRKTLTTAQATSTRWKVQYPNGLTKTYLSEIEARSASNLAPGSTLMAPTA